jgi:hypothetical protein
MNSKLELNEGQIGLRLLDLRKEVKSNLSPSKPPCTNPAGLAAPDVLRGRNQRPFKSNPSPRPLWEWNTLATYTPNQIEIATRFHVITCPCPATLPWLQAVF